MAMNIENISKEELTLIVEAVGSYHPKPDVCTMINLAMKAKNQGAFSAEDAYEKLRSDPAMKKLERDHDRKVAAVLNLKIKLGEVLDRAGEFEVPEPEKK